MRIDHRVDPLGPAHPRLLPDGLHLVGKARDEAEVFGLAIFSKETSGRP